MPARRRRPTPPPPLQDPTPFARAVALPPVVRKVHSSGRLATTGLLPPHVDRLWVTEIGGGVRLSEECLPGAVPINVYANRGRRMVSLSGRQVTSWARRWGVRPPAGGRSVEVDVHRIQRGDLAVLDVCIRGARRSG